MASAKRALNAGLLSESQETPTKTQRTTEQLAPSPGEKLIIQTIATKYDVSKFLVEQILGDAKEFRTKRSPLATFANFEATKVTSDNNATSIEFSAYILGKSILGKQLFVRKCYLDLALIVLRQLEQSYVNKQQKDPNWIPDASLVIGTPGIGKTTFLAYLFFELKNILCSKKSSSSVTPILHTGNTQAIRDAAPSLLESDFQIVLHCGKDSILVDPSGHISTDSVEAFAGVGQPLRSETITTLYLCDAQADNPPLEDTFAMTVVTSSPNRPNYKKLETVPGLETYCMPTWSLEELELCRILRFPSTTSDHLLSLYNKWGGVIRYVLGRKEQASDDLLQQALGESSDWGFMVSRIGTRVIDSSVHPLIHRLFHLVPNDQYQQPTIKFGSNYIISRIFDKMNIKSRNDCINWIQNSEEGFEASLRGQFFEALAHRILSSGGKFPIKCLEENASSEMTTLELKTSGFEQFSDIKDVHVDNYSVPRAKNYAVIDSICAPNHLFSMTVSPRHGINLVQLKKLLTALESFGNGEKKLIFVVPSDLFPSFRRQNFLMERKVVNEIPAGVKQYCLSIPLANSRSSSSE